MEKASKDASRFKDEKAELARIKAEQITKTRKELEAENKSFQDSLTKSVAELRSALSEHIGKAPSADFLSTLRVYKDFNIPMTRQDVETLIRQADGNFMAYRALQMVAADSRFKMSVPAVSDYSGFVDRLERMASNPMMFCPVEYLHEGLEVLPDKRLNAANGVTYGSQGRPSSVDLISHEANFTTLAKDVRTEAKRWESNFIPEIPEFESITTDNGEVSAADQRKTELMEQGRSMDISRSDAENSATELGKTQAESTKKSQAAWAYYAR